MSVPLVCLHGTFGEGADWDGFARRFGRPVIAPDLPGHGARFAEPASSFEDTVAELTDSLPPGSDLVGYSLGGRLALAVAQRLPVRSLVLESAHPGLSADEAALRAAQDDARSIELESDPEPFLASFYSAPLFASFRDHPEFPAHMTARLQRARRDPAALAATFRALSTGRQPNLSGALTASERRTLFVAGALDDKYARLGADLAASSAHVSLAQIPGAGHNVHLESPDAYARVLLAFWESLP